VGLAVFFKLGHFKKLLYITLHMLYFNILGTNSPNSADVPFSNKQANYSALGLLTDIG